LVPEKSGYTIPIDNRTNTMTTGTLKPIRQVIARRERHWVGDGFAVSTIFAPGVLDPEVLSPFILMDYAAPRQFAPATKRRGVGPHPHRGFETVTFAYQGEIEHRDSHGGGGAIGSGDVQWMTAGSGVVHEEMHSEHFTREGGTFEMVQLWVNLPAHLKMTTPRYQALTHAAFPSLRFTNGSGRLIAGTLQGLSGPGQTHTAMTIFDMNLLEEGEAEFELPAGKTTLVFVLQGQALAQRERTVQGGDLIVFERKVAGTVLIAANTPARILVLSGDPLGEPVVAHGPFVMNTREEIHAAIRAYQQGLMGRLSPATD
jgi:quercetin 2,3-dioxygenase